MFKYRLRDWATARGYGLAIGGSGVIVEVKRKLEERRAAGLIEAGFYAENLSSFKFLEGLAVSGPVSLVMVAVPSPIHTLPATAGGRTFEMLIPPTYVRYRATFDDVLGDMKANVLPEDVKAETLRAPLKSLAVHMGLAAYGRNNVTYVAGLGSGHQLCGYAVGTDLETTERSASGTDAETMLERCRDCRACLKVCPTGAIREDRFLISAERCFTLHSESRRPLPAWAKVGRSNCLIGCLACQQICPENKGRLRTAPSGVKLTGDEAEALMEVGRRLESGAGGVSAGAIDERIMASFRRARAKLDRLGMTEDAEVMGRNLANFIRG